MTPRDDRGGHRPVRGWVARGPSKGGLRARNSLHFSVLGFVRLTDTTGAPAGVPPGRRPCV